MELCSVAGWCRCRARPWSRVEYVTRFVAPEALNEAVAALRAPMPSPAGSARVIVVDLAVAALGLAADKIQANGHANGNIRQWVMDTIRLVRGAPTRILGIQCEVRWDGAAETSAY